MTGNGKRRHRAHQKYCILYSDVTPFVIINIYISNCNLITHLVFVTVTDYSYIYFVIKLHNFVNCNQLLPNTANQLYSCAPLKLLQSFQFFFISQLVVWISSLPMSNILSGALLKVRVGLQEIRVLRLFQNQKLKCVTLCSGQNCSDVLFPRRTPRSLTGTVLLR